MCPRVYQTPMHNYHKGGSGDPSRKIGATPSHLGPCTHLKLNTQPSNYGIKETKLTLQCCCGLRSVLTILINFTSNYLVLNPCTSSNILLLQISFFAISIILLLQFPYFQDLQIFDIQR